MTCELNAARLRLLCYLLEDLLRNTLVFELLRDGEDGLDGETLDV